MINVLNNVLFILIWASLFILVNVAVIIITITILYYVDYFAKTCMEGLRFIIKGIFGLTQARYVLSLAHSVRQMIGQFFEPLTVKDTIWIFTVSLIITAVLYAGLYMRFADAASKTRLPVHALVTEFIHERGPYPQASEQFVNMIQMYNENFERRFEESPYLNAVVRFLYPLDDPKELLEKIRSNLTDADNEAKQKAIQQAGEDTHKFYEHNYSSAYSPWAWFNRPENVQKEILRYDSARKKFHTAVDGLKTAQTVRTAVKKTRAACQHSRTALLSLSIAGLDYDNASLERFRNDLEQVCEIALDFAEDANESYHKILRDRAINMGYRFEVVRAILLDDMDEAHLVFNKANKKRLAELSTSPDKSPES